MEMRCHVQAEYLAGFACLISVRTYFPQSVNVALKWKLRFGRTGYADTRPNYALCSCQASKTLYCLILWAAYQ
jgi:hypothetical protein